MDGQAADLDEADVTDDPFPYRLELRSELRQREFPALEAHELGSGLIQARRLTYELVQLGAHVRKPLGRRRRWIRPRWWRTDFGAQVLAGLVLGRRHGHAGKLGGGGRGDAAVGQN